jgi:hypothetical protein
MMLYCAAAMSTQDEQQADRLERARRAFERFHARCFWDMRPVLTLTPADLPMIADRLRRHGGREGWQIASELCP